MIMPKQWRTAALAMAAATVVGAAVASAQQRIETSGRALDANNRIGSGGLNSGRDYTTVPNSGNAIVTGNVTGGAQFRGNVGYTDPRAFRGNLSGAGVDRFVRSSAGPTPVLGDSNAQTRRLFYGDSRGVAPPDGFQQIGSTGGFIPAPPPSRIGSDLRLGSVFDTPTVLLPRPGDLMLGGPMDTSANNQLITASPLYGIRALNTGNASDRDFIRRYTNALGPARRSSADQAAVDRLRDELDENTSGTSDGGREAALQNTVDNQALVNNLPSQPLDKGPLPTGLNSGQQVRQAVQVPPAVRQSAQYQQLAEQLRKYNETYELDPQQAAAREYNAQRRALDAMEKGKEPAQPQQPQQTPGATPDGGPAAPGATPDLPGAVPTDPNAAPGQPGGVGQLVGPTSLTKKAKPLVITSLATGVQSKGLEQLLKDAEALMREQKFVQAIDKYGAAQQAAPNNPLALLGLANAELGASFYARAETHLREAFSDPVLLMAQYDLRQFLGEDRLAFVVKDLKEIANNEKTASRPLVLLAYIAYNEGNERMAAGYLDLAEKRARGDADGFFAKLRKFWQLPVGTEGDTELNK